VPVSVPDDVICFVGQVQRMAGYLELNKSALP
jgi:hypothetical protein